MFGGMISGTVLAVIFVPMFYVIIMPLMLPMKVQARSAAAAILRTDKVIPAGLTASFVHKTEADKSRSTVAFSILHEERVCLTNRL